MNGPLYFEELHVGDSWTSPRRTLTETDVVLFAGLTGDVDPLHVDRHFAEQTPFQRPLAHGLLGMALAAGLAIHYPRMSTTAFVAVREWQFVAPLYVGDTVYALTEVADLRSHGRRNGLVTWRRRLLNHNNEVVQQGVFETLVAKTQSGSHDVLRNLSSPEHESAPASASPKPDNDSDVIPFAA